MGHLHLNEEAETSDNSCKEKTLAIDVVGKTLDGTVGRHRDASGAGIEGLERAARDLVGVRGASRGGCLDGHDSGLMGVARGSVARALGNLDSFVD